MNDEYLIQTEEDIEAVIGPQIERIKEKVYTALDGPMIEFIAKSPLALISTIDSQGRSDVSPKGDPPGFVKVDAHGDLLIPDRPGNRLTFGFRNILQNNKVGLIFFVPNLRETLRIKGTATITKDPALLQELSVKDKPALLCTHVKITECFFHCGKALIRSNLWKPKFWALQGESLMVNTIAKRYDVDDAAKQEIETEIEKAYRDNLY